MPRAASRPQSAGLTLALALAIGGACITATVATTGPAAATNQSTSTNPSPAPPPTTAPEPAPTATTVPPTAVAPTPPDRVVPYQYVAKGYTELLGRAPTPAEWTAGVGYFEQHGCTAASLRAYGDRLVASAEYRRDYPPSQGGDDTGAIVMTLYRFVLNREPDPVGYVENRDLIASGRATPLQAANDLYSTGEFTGLDVPAICNPTDPSYYEGQPGNWTGFPAIATPDQGAPGPDLPEAALQAALNAKSAAGGGTYALPSRSVTGLTTTLVIPGNVTLTTAGDPDPDRYAEMAELVRLPHYTELPGYSGMELVRLDPGAKLLHVWVDGQRDAPDPNNFLVFDVRMLGGASTTVEDDRIGNTDGASSLESDDGDSNVPGATECSDNVIAGNLVEAYSSSHVASPTEPDTDHPQADGIGVYCTDTSIHDNDIVDISDTGIVLFDGASFRSTSPAQLSQVYGNTIVSAGNSYSFAIATDPSYSLQNSDGPGGNTPGVVTRYFSQGGRSAWIHDNIIWSGARTHFDVLLSSGSHDLFGSVQHQNCGIPDTVGQPDCGGGRNAVGARWTGNSSDGLLTEIEMGIYVGGTEDAVIEGNSFPHEVEVTGGFCPKHAVVVAGPYAPGLRIDAKPFVDSAMTSDSCVNPKF
jgi:hypothetical protein